MAYDPSNQMVGNHRLKKYDWKCFYRGVKDSIPDNVPLERGEPVSTHFLKDAGLERELAIRRSHTSILIFFHRALIVWHSKRKNTVDTSTFRS